jgi:hypothetical protein
MALNTTVIKNDLKAKMQAARGAASDSAQLDLICQVFADWLYDQLTLNADVQIQAGDLTVAPGSFANGGGPVGGVGEVNPATLITRIK